MTAEVASVVFGAVVIASALVYSARKLCEAIVTHSGAIAGFWTGMNQDITHVDLEELYEKKYMEGEFPPGELRLEFDVADTPE